jgi:hypothetical protein
LGNDDSDGEGSSSDGSKDKAMCISFRVTLSRILWYKCPMCLREEYDSEAKVVFHTLEVIKQVTGMSGVVKWHYMVL